MHTSLWLIAAGFLSVIAAIRLAVPAFALYYSNRFLRRHPRLHGSVRNISMNLLRGRFTIEQVRLGMTDAASGIDNVVVNIPEIIITVKLGKLMSKKISTHISLLRPELVFANVLNTPEEKKEEPKEKLLQQKVFVKSPVKTAFEKAPPFNIALDVVDGTIRYIDSSAKPQRDIALQNLALTLRSLSNQATSQREPAILNANATLYGGQLNVNVLLQPLEEFLTFDFNMTLQDAELVQLNDYFRQYANVDAHSGSLNVYTELIAMHGSFKGYLKPVFKNIDIIGSEDAHDSIFKKIWERIVTTVIQALENNKADELTTRIEFEGQLTDPQINILAAISGTLKDAFIRSIQSSLQNTLSLRSILGSAISGTTSLIKKVLA